MGDENQPSKKRAAGRELSRDNPGLDEEDDVPETEMGTFKKASDEVLAGRKIVKVRRQQSSTEPSAPSSNPFAGIQLVPPPPAPAAPPVNPTTEAQTAVAKTDGEAPESKESEERQGEGAAESHADKENAAPLEKEVEANQPDHANNGGPSDAVEREPEPKLIAQKETDDSAEKAAETAEKQEVEKKAENNDKEENEKQDASSPLSSFQQLSNSQNAFTGLAGTGFSSSAFSFGSAQKDGSPSQSTLPTFSFGNSNNGSTSLFGTTGASIGVKSEGSAFPAMQEVPQETGEENEETVFSAESALFEFFDGGWKERGKGEVKLNVLKTDTQKARLVMRAKGNLRLILNASIFPDMKLTKMDKKGVTFACVNTATEGKDGLSTFAVKFKDVSIVEEFLSAVSPHKEKPAPTALKTPENSPKASDD